MAGRGLCWPVEHLKKTVADLVARQAVTFTLYWLRHTTVEQRRSSSAYPAGVVDKEPTSKVTTEPRCL